MTRAKSKAHPKSPRGTRSSAFQRCSILRRKCGVAIAGYYGLTRIMNFPVWVPAVASEVTDRVRFAPAGTGKS